MSTAMQLAQHVHDLRADALDGRTRDAALRCLLDLIGSAAAGFSDPGATAARRAAGALLGAGAADIWFAGETASPGAALLANSASASALDLDDGLRVARGHPGAAVIPAAWSALPATPRDSGELLAAIVAGYEIGARVAIGRPAYAPSGAWSAFAVIAAAGRLAGARPETLAQAFGIAAQTSPALPGLAGHMGSDVKEGIPWGSVTGLAALRLAEEGFTGPAEIFDVAGLFDGSRMREGLGGAPLITNTYFKPYACCRHAHAPIDALDALLSAHCIGPQAIERITVHTYRATFNLANTPRPQSLVQAQYSVPFCMAAYAWHGARALTPMSADLLHDPRVTALAGRVDLVHDESLEPLFPARSPARVTLHTRAGAHHASELTDPRGDPARPMDWDELQAKFLLATRHALRPARQQAVLLGIAQAREGWLHPLAQALRAPLSE